MLEKIDETHETVEIQNFLAIRKGRFSLGNITTIIGRQATGKSILAKIVYFGRSYIDSFFSDLVDDEFDLRKFKSEKLKRFLEIFGGLDGYDKKFSISYEFGSYKVEVIRQSDSGRIRLDVSDNFERTAAAVKKEYKKFRSTWNSDEKRRVRPPSKFFFFRENEAVRDFYTSVPSALFVPASRSFYSNISDELFTFLAASERVDPLVAEFGSFFEFAKRRASGDFYGTVDGMDYAKKINEKIEPVIDGHFVREKSKEFIRTSWGKVPLRSSSSGQQEALPLLFSLLEYPGNESGPHLLIVEEPEAHLFPDAQKYILDLIVEQAIKNSCRILFTTHSPYVLACLNNHILRQLTETVANNRPFSVAAYLTDAGSVSSIVDADSHLIDTNFLDSVSEVIASEFMEI
jgi:predicted ATPase